MSALHTCIETNENLDADVPEDLGVVIEGLDAEKNRTETSQYGSGYGLIQAEHVNIISYPEIKQFHISLTNHSAVPVYGTVSANLGKYLNVEFFWRVVHAIKLRMMHRKDLTYWRLIR